MATPGAMDTATQIINSTFLSNTGVLGDPKSTSWNMMLVNVIGYFLYSLGVLLNGFTLVTVLAKRSLTKQHNIFTFNLALTDFISASSYLSDAYLKLPNQQIVKDTFRFSCMFSSNINILSVAVYHFVAVCVDPFGSHGLITTPRCIIACVVSWCISFAAGTLFARYKFHWLYGGFFLTCLVVTGLCYVLIYRAVTSNSCRESMTKKRLEENWRLLQAFSLIYGLTVFCWIWLCVVWLMLHTHRHIPVWLNYLTHACFSLGPMINPTIYWWRLSEFRALLPSPKCCWRNEVIPLNSDV